MNFGDLVYGMIVRAFRAVAPYVARSGSKLARGIEGRRETALRFAGWARESRNPDRRLAWFHAPSVGEGLQARAVLEALLEREPSLQLAFTYFSPSAEALAEKMPVDVADYVPWDLPTEVRPVMEALRPRLLAFTKTEVWPVLAREAHLRGVPVVLIAATLPAQAGRLRAPARWYLRDTFDRLRMVGAISHEDGERFHKGLGVARDRIVVTGDPGIDSAWIRARAVDPEATHLQPFRRPPAPTVVAGSTWPPDEEILLQAAGRVREAISDVRLVVAPHEPSGERVRTLEEALTAGGWSAVTLGALESRGVMGDANAVVVDRVGVLADLYSIGTVAYVGGGFHSDGLHSVLEPAASGLPVVFGPRHTNARAAAQLLERGAAREVEDARTLFRTLEAWLLDDGRAAEASRSASGYIQEHRGAAARTAELLQQILASG